MLEAIKDKDKAAFMKTFDWFTQACNACHVTQNLAFLTVRKSTHRRSSIIYEVPQ